jgi:hypothetical protein
VNVSGIGTGILAAHISKSPAAAGSLRTMLVQGAHYILGPLEKTVICDVGG